MIKLLGKWLPLFGFGGSEAYWKRRYRLGGDSGRGSEGKAAEYKAVVLNEFIQKFGIGDAIEFGCGDGRQLAMIHYPQYVGLDVSSEAVAACRQKFVGDPSKRFVEAGEYRGETADVSLSLDVIYHLVEDEVYDAYLERLFSAGRKYVVIYSTTASGVTSTFRHVRHRPVDQDIARRFPEFARMSEFESGLPAPVENGKGGYTHFLVYRRTDTN